MTEYREIKGRLGFFGYLSRILLVGWQVLMLIWTLLYLAELAPVFEGVDRSSDAEMAGAGLGFLFGSGVILMFWAGGTVVSGLFALLTRRTTTIVLITDKENE